MTLNKIDINFRIPQFDDIDVIIDLMQEYYDYEEIKLTERVAHIRLAEFIKQYEFGKIWLILVNEDMAGYIVVTYGYGLEHGKNATIDEFYIRENFRGLGIGRRTIEFVEKEIRPLGIVSIHGEVERKNKKAQLFWEELGYQRYDRFPITKMIDKT